ncbi:MAG: bifunctional nicotinamidase/pyrazinamidase [Rectinemataceae bacterium]
MKIDRKRSALIVVDLQKDFCEGGSSAVHGGDRVVGPINAISPLFDHVVLTQDWHPKGHISFASSWPGRSLYDTVEADGIPQVLWSDHCVQGSEGAAFHPGLDTDRASIILRKGMRTRLESYSGFFENDRTTPTGLDGWLRGVGASELFITGLATDFCVLYTVLDALRLGYKIFVVEDGVCGFDLPPGGSARAMTAMRRKGATFLDSAVLLIESEDLS